MTTFAWVVLPMDSRVPVEGDLLRRGRTRQSASCHDQLGFARAMQDMQPRMPQHRECRRAAAPPWYRLRAIMFRGRPDRVNLAARHGTVRNRIGRAGRSHGRRVVLAPSRRHRLGKSSRSCRTTAASPTWSLRAGSAFRRRPACGGYGRSRRQATSRATGRCSTRSVSAIEVTVFAMVHLAARPRPTCAPSRPSCGAAAGARMLDAVGRDRLHPQMRGARPEDLSGLRRRAHRRRRTCATSRPRSRCATPRTPPWCRWS